MWDELVHGAVVLADTRRLDTCYPAIDFFETRGVPCDARRRADSKAVLVALLEYLIGLVSIGDSPGSSYE